MSEHESLGGAQVTTPDPAPATDFATLLKAEFKPRLRDAFRPRSHEQEGQIQSAVDELVERALGDTRLISGDAMSTIRAAINKIDGELTDQVNLVLHHEEFMAIESAWRGLHYLVSNTETDRMLKIAFMSISKKELGGTLDQFKGVRWDRSPIFRKVYTERFSQLGGEPFGCLVGDYYFDQSPGDVALVERMANICAAAHAPFIAGAAPRLLDMDSWLEVMEPDDLAAKTSTPDHVKWNALREKEDSRYVGLTLPRVLARLPYGATTTPVEEFDFEEDVRGKDHKRYCWMNAAYAMARNIKRSFKLYGWCTRIRGVEAGGTVTNLPVHTFETDARGKDIKCPTEVAIDERRDRELADLGLMPLIYRKNSDVAVFLGAQSLKKPQEYENPAATANARLSARLSYLLPVCRFAHYLKAMVRNKIGSNMEREELQSYLQAWITNYVIGNPANAGPEAKARKPLLGATVTVASIEENPGYYTAIFDLRPHYQLEGAHVSLRLVSQLQTAAA